MPPTPAITPALFATFGALLRHLRRRARLSQRELAITVGYSESQISRREQHQRLPDLSSLAALAQELAVADQEVAGLRGAIDGYALRYNQSSLVVQTLESDPTRDWILAGIDRSERGKWTIKLRTLVQEFGYTAQQRVRQSTLVAIETTLSDWGIAFAYPGGYTPDDRITLSRRAPVPVSAVVTPGP